jgi:carbon-monoxide dehydrogenase medium subunit
MDIAVANAACQLRFEDNVVSWARVVIGAVAPTALLVAKATDALVGKPLTDETVGAAATASSTASRPIADMRGSIKQRKHLAAVLTERTIRIAAERALGS